MKDFQVYGVFTGENIDEDILLEALKKLATEKGWEYTGSIKEIKGHH